MPTVEIQAGTIHYEEVGPRDGRPVVCVHGYLMGGDLFAGLGTRLAARGFRCLMPTWPLGAHPEPMKPDADMTPRGVAGTIAAFLDALELEDVVLLGNDSGGALSQVVAVDHPERLGALVLTNCDALDKFPPFPFNIVFHIAKSPTWAKLLLGPMRFTVIRHSPLAFGLLARRFDAAQTTAWLEPARANKAIRRDLARFLRTVDAKDLVDVATRLDRFDGPVTLVWGAAARGFTVTLGRRLADKFRSAKFVELKGAKTFVSLDEPDRLADEIAAARLVHIG